MLVISNYTFNTPRLDRAEQGAATTTPSELGEEAGLTTGVAGGAAQLNDYSQVTRDRIPLVVAAITLVTFLVLIVVLRAIPLAAIAVGLNLAHRRRRLRHPHPALRGAGGPARWAATTMSTRSGRR